MKRLSISFLLLLVATAAHAGVVYGTLTDARDGGPLAEVEVIITCTADSYTGATDGNGSYSLRVSEVGECRLSIELDGQPVEAVVYSGERPARYDFELVREGDRWELRRR